MAVFVPKFLRQLRDVLISSPADGEVLAYDEAEGKWVNAAGGGGGGAPTDATYLVTTANSELSAEVVVGATPGGELGGTWAAPTVDATHSGSSHASVQAAAEATAAAALSAHLNDTSDAHDASAISIADAGGDFDATEVEGALAELQADHESDAAALAAHLADTSDAHDASAISSVAAGGLSATDVQAALNELDSEKASATSFNDHSARHENGGADEISIAGLDGIPTELQNHLDDATDAHDASAVSVDSTSLSGTATTVQGSLEELDNLLDDHSARHENGGADEISLAGLSGVPADVPPSTRTLTAGNGLSGGGDLSADRSFAVNVDDSTIEINADTLRVKDGGITAAKVAADVATQAELDAHINDSSDAHDASAISVADAGGNYTATEVEAALAEVMDALQAHEADTSDAHDASAISFSPTGTIAATDVQAAIAEVASEAGGGGVSADDESLIVHMEVFA